MTTQIYLAVKAVRNKGMSKRDAIKKYAVSLSGINRALRKKKESKARIDVQALAALRRNRKLAKANAVGAKRTRRLLDREKAYPYYI